MRFSFGAIGIVGIALLSLAWCNSQTLPPQVIGFNASGVWYTGQDILTSVLSDSGTFLVDTVDHPQWPYTIASGAQTLVIKGSIPEGKAYEVMNLTSEGNDMNQDFSIDSGAREWYFIIPITYLHLYNRDSTTVTGHLALLLNVNAVDKDAMTGDFWYDGPWTQALYATIEVSIPPQTQTNQGTDQDPNADALISPYTILSGAVSVVAHAIQIDRSGMTATWSYILKQYKSGSTFRQTTLRPDYQNIGPGKNVYTISAQTASGTQVIDTQTVTSNYRQVKLGDTTLFVDETKLSPDSDQSNASLPITIYAGFCDYSSYAAVTTPVIYGQKAGKGFLMSTCFWYDSAHGSLLQLKPILAQKAYDKSIENMGQQGDVDMSVIVNWKAVFADQKIRVIMWDMSMPEVSPDQKNILIGYGYGDMCGFSRSTEVRSIAQQKKLFTITNANEGDRITTPSRSVLVSADYDKKGNYGGANVSYDIGVIQKLYTSTQPYSIGEGGGACDADSDLNYDAQIDRTKNIRALHTPDKVILMHFDDPTRIEVKEQGSVPYFMCDDFKLYSYDQRALSGNIRIETGHDFIVKAYATTGVKASLLLDGKALPLSTITHQQRYLSGQFAGSGVMTGVLYDANNKVLCSKSPEPIPTALSTTWWVALPNCWAEAELTTADYTAWVNTQPNPIGWAYVMNGNGRNYDAIRIYDNDDPHPYTPKSYNPRIGNFTYNITQKIGNLRLGTNTYRIVASVHGQDICEVELPLPNVVEK